MRQDERAAFDHALRGARQAAWPPGQFVGQESFMSADEILGLARRAGVGPGVSVLDVCCGVAGPGRLCTAELGCSYLGVDSSASAIGLARKRADGLPCRFQVGSVPPLPAGEYDVVLLLETLLAFPDKDALLGEISSVLADGGRFAFTVEAGHPLTSLERAVMPDADTVWLVPLPELLARLARASLTVRALEERTRSHRTAAGALADAFEERRSAIARGVGLAAVDELLAAHRLWSAWLTTGRVRKFAVVAEKSGS